ncbi:metal ABC transporter solute-binding protein, Zn/Mn family [Candidatus Venteria ishoeyi]|uniref:High-affinity zinc uptake system protein ZnuA n=1 Tax=Candidatus Venteria ishoeyi TaxID=1899563 RepID=A0A1H6F7N7_9GAMM|nr:zinc ABC transporter substrate-binding protein [Candidatus Venteria ishoeyi]MDM8547220.1 zinc ABC transporter substrate-binding protein [Candidatus Venteria ishoeyi]SEH05074.1 High-affinity zinc uptake system binding-protein ZnuA precursor [Candidatus Venteria ishoeyi]
MRFYFLCFFFLYFPLQSAFAAPLSIFVSIFPQKYFVEQIGQSQVRVSVMVGAGQSPATYEPTPQQMAQLNHASLYFRIGVPFERVWMQRLQQNVPQLPVVDLREGIDLHPLPNHQHQEKHGHDKPSRSSLDPHIWLHPLNAIIMAKTIRDQLSHIDPVNQSLYQQRYQHLEKNLLQLHEVLKKQLMPFAKQRFLVFHPSWGYFAKAYGLEQLAIEHEGKSPGARALVQLITQAKQEAIKVIFVQPQFSQQQAQRIADAIAGQVIAIDPLAENYPENLRRAADAFVVALSP